MKIMKSFSFCYGHRVWNQKLTNGLECTCVRCHGHSGKVDLILTAPSLSNGMIIDFNELKNIKDFIDSFIDHRFLIDKNDPLLQHYLKMLECSLDDFKEPEYGLKRLEQVTLDKLPKELKEFGESLVVLNFAPTSEMLAIWLSQVISILIKPWTSYCELKVSSLRWWESDKSYAEFSE